MKFTFHRDRVIATTKGHCLRFVKGVPTEVPALVYDEVIAAGGIPESEIPEDPVVVKAKGPQDPAERELELTCAFETILLRNKREDFTAGNVPHLKAVNAALGWEVDAKERDIAWVKFRTKEA